MKKTLLLLLLMIALAIGVGQSHLHHSSSRASQKKGSGKVAKATELDEIPPVLTSEQAKQAVFFYKQGADALQHSMIIVDDLMILRAGYNRFSFPEHLSVQDDYPFQLYVKNLCGSPPDEEWQDVLDHFYSAERTHIEKPRHNSVPMWEVESHWFWTVNLLSPEDKREILGLFSDYSLEPKMNLVDCLGEAQFELNIAGFKPLRACGPRVQDRWWKLRELKDQLTNGRTNRIEPAPPIQQLLNPHDVLSGDSKLTDFAQTIRDHRTEILASLNTNDSRNSVN